MQYRDIVSKVVDEGLTRVTIESVDNGSTKCLTELDFLRHELEKNKFVKDFLFDHIGKLAHNALLNKEQLYRMFDELRSRLNRMDEKFLGK